MELLNYLICCLFLLVLLVRSCLFCNHTDCSSPGSSIHGISNANILTWVAISFSRGTSQPRYRTHISCIDHHGSLICKLYKQDNLQGGSRIPASIMVKVFWRFWKVLSILDSKHPRLSLIPSILDINSVSGLNFFFLHIYFYKIFLDQFWFTTKLRGRYRDF